MEERRRCTTVRQLELMTEFLEAHRDLALGRVRSKEARAMAARLWQECAGVLNAEGPARTGKEWSKVWNDHKCKVRAKLVSINANQQATGGGPSNAPTLTLLEERVANILGRDIGPLPNLRQDQFASISYDGNVVVEQVEGHHDQQDLETVFNETDLEQTPASPIIVLPPHAISPVPSATGQAPSLQNSPRRATVQRGRVRHVRGRRRIENTSRVPTTPAPTQSGRSALEESRLMVLRIEETRAEAALANAQAMSSFAQSFRLIAESIDRLSQKYCQTPSPQGHIAPRTDD